MSQSLHDEIARSVERVFGENVDPALRAAVRDGQWPDALWRLAAQGGFASAFATEDQGGVAATWSDAWPILHGIGRWRVPLPLAETMIARLLLSLAGIEAPDDPVALVDAARIADGARVVDAAKIADGVRIDPQEATAGGRVRIRARARRVPWARHCRWALVATREPIEALGNPAPGRLALPTQARGGGDLLWIDLRSDDAVRIHPGANLAGEPCDDVEFEGAEALRIANPLPGIDDPIRLLGALARSVMIVGALESALAQSIRHANERVQFGRPIGRYQAIQHALAVFAGEVAAARMASQVAADSAPSSGTRAAASSAFDVAVAKLRSSEAATRAAPIAHQIHGAIGFTLEHPLHEATCRCWTWRGEFGTDAWWAERLGMAAIAGGSGGFWPSLTRRSFEPQEPRKSSTISAKRPGI